LSPGERYQYRERKRRKSRGSSVTAVLAIILVGVVCLGAFLVTASMLKMKDTEEANSTYNLEIEQLRTRISEMEIKAEEDASKIAEQESRLNILAPPISSGTPTANMDDDGEKICYLTFDDGPSANTPKVLAILKQYNIKATFFVIGKQNPEYLRQAAQDGHAIGVHSMTHDYSKIYKSTEAFWADWEAEHAWIKEQTGIDTNICRFPGGGSNTVSRKYKKGIMTELAKQMDERGIAYFDWNTDSGDAAANTVSKDKIVANIKRTLVNNKANILFHDAPAKTTTVQALPEIIQYISSKGYRFEALSASAPTCHQKVNN